MDRAKLKRMFLAVTFQNGMRVSTGKRWGGIALSVVIFFIAILMTSYSGYGLIVGTVAVYAFWVLWRQARGYPDEFWGSSELATPQAVEVPKSTAVDTAQQPVTVIVEKKSSGAGERRGLRRKVWGLPLFAWLLIVALPVAGVIDACSSPNTTTTSTNDNASTEPAPARQSEYSWTELTSSVQACMDTSGFELISNSFTFIGTSGNAMVWFADDSVTGTRIFARLYGSPKVARRSVAAATDVMRYWEKTSRWGVFGPSPTSDVAHLKSPLQSWERCLTTTFESKWLPSVAA